MNFSAFWQISGLLAISNVFMAIAWYGHLKSFKDSPFLMVLFISWGIAFFEYVFQIPANRIGSRYFDLGQLKVLQEVISMGVFPFFTYFYMKRPLRLDFVWAGLCLVAAAYFMFRNHQPD